MNLFLLFKYHFLFPDGGLHKILSKIANVRSYHRTVLTLSKSKSYILPQIHSLHFIAFGLLHFCFAHSGNKLQSSFAIMKIRWET